MKKIKKEKEKFFSQLDQYKNNPDLEKIYTFLSMPKAVEYFNKPDLNLSDLCKYLKSPFKKQEITEFSEIQNKIKRLESRYSQYKNKLIHNMYVCDILGISKTELARWKSDGRLPVAKTQSFRKRGKHWNPITLKQKIY